MTLEKAKKIIKSECYIADLLNLDRTRMVNTALDTVIEAAEQTRWIPVSERLPSEEEQKKWINEHLGGIGYLYPCLVTRYSSINPKRTVNNPYVARHCFDGEDFVNNGEEVCTEYVIAWMPLPEPYKAEGSDKNE